MKKIQLTPDAHLWAKKWSTWLAIASASLTAGAVAFAAMPAAWQAEFPAGLGGYLAMAAVACAMLVPVATSVSQQKLKDQ